MSCFEASGTPCVESKTSGGEKKHRKSQSKLGTNQTEASDPRINLANLDFMQKQPQNEDELKALLQQINAYDFKEAQPKPKPIEPRFKANTSTEKKLIGFQKFINSFEYNHTGTDYFEIRKDLGMKRVNNTAREIIRESLPIKCVEAVFLACYLTMGMKELVRMPIRFQSTVDGHIFRHIVLAVKYNNKWGALGLSRKDTLMYKELKFDSLSDLLLDFKLAYEEIYHRVQHIGVGLPLSHDKYSVELIQWRTLMIHIKKKQTWDEISDIIEKYVINMDYVAVAVKAGQRYDLFKSKSSASIAKIQTQQSMTISTTSSSSKRDDTPSSPSATALLSKKIPALGSTPSSREKTNNLCVSPIKASRKSISKSKSKKKVKAPKKKKSRTNNQANQAAESSTQQQEQHKDNAEPTVVAETEPNATVKHLGV